jgi:NitT/TauT family transport system permease protein
MTRTTGGLMNFMLRLVLVAATLAVWEALVRVTNVPAFILPTPSSIFVALYRGITSTLYLNHIGITLAETLIGFLVGAALAFALGIAVALSRPIEYFLYPFIVMFQAMPKVALAPLIIVWFGLGLTSKVVNAALVAFFPLMVNTIVGLRSAEEEKIDLMRSLAANRWQLFWMLQLPNAMPYIFAGLEIAMIFALIGAIVAEFVGAQSGLGMLIQSMNFTMDVAGQFSVLLILSLLGLVLNGMVNGIRRRVLFWDPSQKVDAVASEQKRGGTL